MKTTSKNIELSTSAVMPDGVYFGIWNGYYVTVSIDEGHRWRIRTDSGIRGWADVNVTVADGVATIETK